MPSDRFRIIQAQFLPLPGVCAICDSNRRDCVDFGINVDYLGVFMICVECVKEVCNVDELNLMDKGHYKKLVEENKKLTDQLFRVWDGMREFSNAVVASIGDYRKHIVTVIPDVILTIGEPEKKSKIEF